MNKVTINWHQTNLSSIDLLDDTAFYAFSRGNNLIYIGIAFRQTAVDEVRYNFGRLGLSATGMSIWLGYVDKKDTTYNRITNEIVKDAECLMIYMNQPSQNTQCKVNYTGRSNFRVVSRNLSLLRNRISCDNKGVLRYS